MDNKSKLEKGAVRKMFLSAIVVVIAGTILLAYNKKDKRRKRYKD